MSSGGLTLGQAASLQTFGATNEQAEMYERMADECTARGEHDLASEFAELARETRRASTQTKERRE
jgi:hypothetical protein